MTRHAAHPVETFDYVVIGAGAAGAIIASRLAKRHDATVCLLEAGGSDRSMLLQLPAGFHKVMFSPKYTWPFTTRPSEHTNNRAIPIPQGRTLGGSTAIGGQIYNRGQREDYDEWAALGNEGWSYEEVLPYFKRSERFIDGLSSDSAWHGLEGEMPVTSLDWLHPLCEAFISGAESLGIPRNHDYNGETQKGVGYFQRTIDNGLRVSTASAFLTDLKEQGNLSIRTNATASTLVIKRKRVIGAYYFLGKNRQHQHEVHARREVILCCGAINTPKLLQLSGIGPGSLLQQRGIPVYHALAGIGEHLSDHFSVRCVARVHNTLTINDLYRLPHLAGQAWRWLRDRPSILSLNSSLVYVFWKSEPSLSRADLQGVFAPAGYRDGQLGRLSKQSGMTCGFLQQRPWSKGHVRVSSRDPFDAPEVQPNYISDERDCQITIRGVQLARRLLQTDALQPYLLSEDLPGEDVRSDDEILAFVRQYGSSSYNLNGTARMGRADDPLAVVDSRLRVIGLRGLRIADASVMPSIPSANIGAATMMIAEKAVDMIAADHDHR